MSRFRQPQLRLRREDDAPASEDFEPIEPIEPEVEPPPEPNRRPLILGLIAFVAGCLLLAACLAAYAYSRGSFGAPASATAEASAPATDLPPSQTQTPAPTATGLPPTPEFTATEAASAPPAARTATLSEIAGDVQMRVAPDGVWNPVAADSPLAPGTTVLTGQDSRAKITLAEGTVIRLSSQTQLTLVEAGGSDSDPIDRFQLDFGKLWAILAGPLNGGVFEVQLPIGVAAVRGSFLSAEYNSTTVGIVISCLEGSCHYENPNGAVDFGAQQQAVSVDGAAPRVEPISANQLNDWAVENVPEVQTLTPPPSETPAVPPTRTRIPTSTKVPSRTPIPTATQRSTRTPTNTRTPKPTATASNTPTNTPTVGPTATFGAPARLAFTIQPTTAPIGAAFQVQVAIQDLAGATVTNATNPISLAIGANGGGASLAGITTVGPVNGLATFMVSLDRPGSFTIVASTPGFPSAISAAFDVVGSNALLFVISGLGSDVTRGQAVTITVTAFNADGSAAVDYVGTITFQSSDGQATLPANYAFTLGDRGTHTFIIVFNTVGSQTLKVVDTFTPTLAGYAGTNVK